MGPTLRRNGASIAVVAAALLVLVLVAASAAGAATLTVRGSVEQVQVTGAKKGARLALVTRRGRTVQTQKAGPLGGAVFRDVTPGKGYRVGGHAVTVLSGRAAPPSTRTYRQKI